MALELKYASDATLLLDDLVDSLGSPGNAAGVVVPVLMPSLPLVDRTKAALARRHGVAMGVAFLLPGAFIEHMAQLIGLDPLHPSWRPQGLAWRLVPLLAAMVEEGDTPRLGPACVDTRARHALARDVADRFDQYLYFRPEMIAAWDRGEAWDALPESAQGDEAWQRDLWRRLSAGLADHPHPAVRLRDLETRIHAGQGDVPTSLEVLASGPLPPTLLPLLRALATRTRVCLRALLPSTEYLGDLRAGRTQMRAGQAVDLAWEGHPLLSHLGKQAVDSFRSFEEALVTEGQEYDVIALPEPRSDRLLARLQADIRAARQPGAATTVPPVTADRSVRVHRCHGARREVEVLRDELLDAFESLPDLRASEVLILAPQLDLYGPLAEAILRDGDPSLPLRLAERRIDRSEPLVRGMHTLLRVAAGRVPLSEGLALLALPAVAARVESLGIDPATLADRVRASGITWGLNAAHRLAMDAGDQGTGTWREGLDRLLAGVWLGDADTASDGHQRPALPVSGDLGADPATLSASLDWLDGSWCACWTIGSVKPVPASGPTAWTGCWTRYWLPAMVGSTRPRPWIWSGNFAPPKRTMRARSTWMPPPWPTGWTRWLRRRCARSPGSAGTWPWAASSRCALFPAACWRSWACTMPPFRAGPGRPLGICWPRRRPAREACQVLLAPAGGRSSEPATLRRDAAEDLGAAGAGRLTRGRVQRKAGEERAQVWSGV